MCNLYSIRATRDEVARHFGATDRGDGPHLAKDYVAAPAAGKLGNPGYVVRNEAGARVLSVMRWGFPRPDGKNVVNVRNYESPFWRSALVRHDRRCLVPVTHFQEWSETRDPATGKRKPFWFKVPAVPIFAFAGIWRPTEGDAVYAFLTSGYDGDPSAHIVGRVHPKACPVIVHPEDYDRWLTADIDEALSLACPFPSQLMAVD